MNRANFRGPAISTSSPPAETSLTLRSLILLVAGLVTFGMGFSLLFAILPPVGRQLGFSTFQIGIIFGMGSVCLFFGAPLWGRKSDLWGRKPVLMIGFIGYAVAQLGFVAFIELGLNGILAGTAVFGALLLCRIASSLTVSGVNGPASGYIADTTTEQDRTAKLSWVNASFGIGSALGPGIGGLLAGFGVLVPFYAVSGWALVMALVIWLLLPEPRVHRASRSSKPLHLGDKRILPVIILTGVSFFAITANLQLVALYVQDHIGYNSEDTAQASGALLTILAIVALATQVFIIRRYKLHPYTLLAIGMPIGTLGLLGVTLSSNMLAFGVFFALLGLAVGLVGPALSGAASLSVGAGEQGGVAGIVEASRALGSLAASLVGTWLYHYGPRVPYTLITVALFLMSLYAFYLWNRRRRTLAAQRRG